MTNKTKILSIEPSENDRSLLHKILVDESTGFALEFAQTITEFGKLKQKKNYDVLLTEIQLPGFKGVEVLHKIEQLSPNTPIIVITQNDSEKLASNAIKNGAEDYLLKNNLHLKLLPRIIRFACEKKKFKDSEIQYKEKLIKTNRFYNFISHVNRLIIKTKNKEKLLQESCDIAIRFGHFQMAWVGLADKDSELIKPYCWAGNEKGYLTNINIKISNDSPE
ncbi:MAG: response regulator [Bacteroidales bacterium]|nr:response regulator [Bacteroidales bacterium]